MAEWEKKTGRTVRILMATSKDITDAILADPVRARQVAVIDMRYWQYRPDGSLWAPPGGKNLAFREMIAQDFGRSDDTPPDTTPLQVYRQVREYHDRYPDKAIVAWHGGAGPIPVLMAGGAQALMRNPSAGQGQGRSVDRTTLDGFVREQLATTLMKMQPRDGAAADPEQTWCLADDGGESVLFYSLAGDSITLLRTLSQNSYTGLWFDPRTGDTRPLEAPVSGEAGAVIRKPTAEAWLVLLRQQKGDRRVSGVWKRVGAIQRKPTHSYSLRLRPVCRMLQCRWDAATGGFMNLLSRSRLLPAVFLLAGANAVGRRSVVQHSGLRRAQ